MTETKWTQGPWAILCGNGRKIWDVLPPDDEMDDEINDETRANAQLMVAAPDLYAANDWVDEIKGFGKGMSEWIPVESVKDDEEFEITLSGKEIRALIDARRKARGE